MLKYLLLVLFAASLVGCKEKVFNTNNSEISIKKGEDFTVKLPSNHSTGYQWHEISPIDTNFLDLKWVDYKVLNPNEDGGKAFELWKFKALKSGKTKFSLKYWRPWDAATALDTIIFNVTVK